MTFSEISSAEPPAHTALPPPAAPHDWPAAKKFSGLRLRALLVGIPLLVGICLLSVYADMVAQKIQFGVMQLAPPAVAALFLLALFNRALTRLLKREFLSRADILIIYAMLLTGVLISTRGVIEKLIPPLAYLPYAATRENRLNELLSQHLPAWALPFVPSSQAGPPPEVIRGYYEGAHGGPIPWSAWAGPMLAWFALICCVIWVFACLATLLRRQWMDNEQLRFPLTTLPLAIIRDESGGEPFFSNPLMWIGFAVSALIFALNGLRANFPDFPEFTLVVNFGGLFTERPWSQMQGVQVFLSLAAFGFAYFLPTELLFSMWFFYLLTRLQDAFIAQLGFQPMGIGTHGTNLWQGYQAVGAYVVLVLAQLRLSWPYFRQVWRTAFSHAKQLDDADELMSYRSAIIGLFAGFAAIVLWLALAGMNPFLAAAQMGIYIFFITIVMSRAVCEAGMLGTETSFLPSHLINLVYPLPHFGATNLAMLGLTDVVFTRDLRGMLLSPLLDAQKMAGELKLRQRSLAIPLALTVVISFVTASTFFLWLHYTQGDLALYRYPHYNAANLYGRAASAINGSAAPRDATAYGGVITGAIVMLALVALRARFLWWPLHPLGYALAPMGTMNVYWFPFFAAWLIKSLTLRFGGVETFRKLSPFMLGLILGEFLMGVFWAVMNMWRGWNTPDFPWP